MFSTGSKSETSKLRVLFAIAHYGTKNRPFLERMLEAIRTMDFQVDIVVLSEGPKDLPDDVELRIGLPSENPWSLPFAHRSLFAERMADYNLFVYSEDDTLIQQRHLDTFLELSAVLPDDQLLGSLRFEVDDSGARSYCSFHSYYRWAPRSSSRSESCTFARFTNDHAAWYVVTRDQLQRAIASGGFLVPPHKGQYDMLVSAATDIFTQCGFHRVICLERIEDQLVHHMPNVYLGQLGIDETAFAAQITALRRIAEVDPDDVPELLEPHTHIGAIWDKHTYPWVPDSLDELVPASARSVLSVGSGAGELESILQSRGHSVTSIPIDPVVAAVQERRGVRTLAPDLSALAGTEGTLFDRILLVDVLSYLPDPVAALRLLVPHLSAGGTILATAPDHRRYGLRNMVLRAASRWPLPHSFRQDGLHRTDPRVVRGWVQASGLELKEVRHRAAQRIEPFGRGGLRGRATGNTIVVVAALGDNA